MKIVTVVGARPQFIKVAATSRVLRLKYQEVLVHTGQHYDKNMSQAFFEELDIPSPDYNLQIGSGGHGQQTGRMLAELETLYQEEKPDLVLVYGDTNSTLAGALAASKMLIPVVHVEAGLRSYLKEMPEEQNRVLTDHISDVLFAPTQTAVSNLRREGIEKNVFNSGDVMYDAVLYYQKTARDKGFDLPDEEYILATIHRAENTDDPVKLADIVSAINDSGKKFVLPLHPRTAKCLQAQNLSFSELVKVVAPVGYLEMLWLEMNASKVLTDSGGVQKEAFLLGKPCITMRSATEWVETVDSGWNVLVGTDPENIINAISEFSPTGRPPHVFGNGQAARNISETLEKIYG